MAWGCTKELDQVFLLETIPEDQWLSSDVILVRDTFLEFLQSSRPESFNSACRILIQDLTQGLSQDDTAFRDVLERYLRELRANNFQAMIYEKMTEYMEERA